MLKSDRIRSFPVGRSSSRVGIHFPTRRDAWQPGGDHYSPCLYTVDYNAWYFNVSPAHNCIRLAFAPAGLSQRDAPCKQIKQSTNFAPLCNSQRSTRKCDFIFLSPHPASTISNKQFHWLWTAGVVPEIQFRLKTSTRTRPHSSFKNTPHVWHRTLCASLQTRSADLTYLARDQPWLGHAKNIHCSGQGSRVYSCSLDYPSL